MTVDTHIEQFDEACVCLEQLFPKSFSDLSYVSVNVSKKDTEVSEDERRYIGQFLKLDQPVFDLADSFLDQTIDRAFPSREEFQRKLGEFKELCSRRYHNFEKPRLK